MTSTPEQLARKLRKVADDLPLTAERAMERATQVIATSVNREYAQIIGPDMRLSGTVRRRNGGMTKGSRVRAIGDTNKGQIGTQQTVGRVRMVGPAQLIESATKPHLIIAQGMGTRATARRVTGRLGAHLAFGSSGRGMFRQSQRSTIGRRSSDVLLRNDSVRRANRALDTPRGPRAYAFHPGTRGKRTFFVVVDREARTVRLIFNRYLSDDMREEFS